MPQTDDYAGLGGRFYSAYIERPLLGRAVIRLLWGGDARPMYASLETLQHIEAGVTVVDAACGAGLALRWLEPSRVGRYIGADNSPAMLERARERANRRGFRDAEFELATSRRSRSRMGKPTPTSSTTPSTSSPTRRRLWPRLRVVSSRAADW